MIIYNTENAIEVKRYSIVDTMTPTIGLKNPSGITLNDDESEVYITSDADDSTLHYYSIEIDQP